LGIKQPLAHIRKSDLAEQTLIDHLLAVSARAGQLAGKIGLREPGELIGLGHDLGKASAAFQNYLQSAHGEIDSGANLRGKIDHSTARAQWLFDNSWGENINQKIAAEILSLCIASHHSGLIDCLTPAGEDNLSRRLHKTEEDTHKLEALAEMEPLLPSIDAATISKATQQIAEKVKGLRDTKDSAQTSPAYAGLPCKRGSARSSLITQ
jgi:CRISPR-associated endonuclease Cas3-HD